MMAPAVREVSQVSRGPWVGDEEDDSLESLHEMKLLQITKSSVASKLTCSQNLISLGFRPFPPITWICPPSGGAHRGELL